MCPWLLRCVGHRGKGQCEWGGEPPSGELGTGAGDSLGNRTEAGRGQVVLRGPDQDRDRRVSGLVILSQRLALPDLRPSTQRHGLGVHARVRA